MKLYEISESIRAVMDKVEAADGELTPELAAELDGLDLAWNDKAENVALFIRESEANAEAVESETKRLGAKARALHNRADWLKGYLFDQMQRKGVDKFKGTLAGARIQQGNPAVNVLDAAQIPQEFYVPQDPTLDKRTLLEALKLAPVPGAEVVRRPFIRIT